MRKRKSTRDYGKAYAYAYEGGGRVRVDRDKRMFESLNETPRAPLVGGEVDLGRGFSTEFAYRKGSDKPGNDPRKGWGIGGRFTVPLPYKGD